MQLNLPGNTGKTPATYVSTFKKLGTKTTYEQRYREAHEWRESSVNKDKVRKAQKWLTKYGV